MNEKEITEFGAMAKEIRPYKIQYAAGEDSMPFVIVPNDHQGILLEHLQECPTSIRQRVKFDSLKSFLGYISEFKTSSTKIFVDRKALYAKAVFDYHEAGLPEWGRHCATLQFSHSENWRIWENSDRTVLSQDKFAEFIDENRFDIAAPTENEGDPAAGNPKSSDLLKLIGDLESTVKMTFASKFSTASGRAVGYSEEAGGIKGTLEIPESIVLGLKVYDCLEKKYPVTIRLNCRVPTNKEASFKLWYTISQKEEIENKAIDDICKEIHLGAKIEPFRGMAENQQKLVFLP
jgi:uncharacterized protein YfdQ (DUF2303 family)